MWSSQLPSPKSCSFNKLMSTLHHAPSPKNMTQLNHTQGTFLHQLEPKLNKGNLPPIPSPHNGKDGVCVCVWYNYCVDWKKLIFILWTFFFHEKTQDFCNDIIIEYFDHNFSVKPKSRTLSIRPIRMLHFELSEIF